MSKRAFAILLLIVSFTCVEAEENKRRLSPSGVGWGNLFVPGLGATLRNETTRGVLEASTELGLFYSGTFGVREGSFTIDTTVYPTTTGPILQTLISQSLQQFGIKLHMWNTFYHYQQASLEMADTEWEKNNPQKLYLGKWDEALLAPFKWKNMSSPWVYGMLAATTAYLVYDYASSTPVPTNYVSTPAENVMLLAHNSLIEPLGSSFGEESLFRGFIQREIAGYTGSITLAILAQTAMFTLLHPAQNRLPAMMGGLYWGFLAYHLGGDLEKGMAAHFWLNVINGTISFLEYQRNQNKPAIFSISLGLRL